MCTYKTSHNVCSLAKLFIVPRVPLNFPYPHLHKKIFIFQPIFVKFRRQFINKYKSYSANFRKLYFIVSELCREEFTIYFNHFQCVCQTSPTSC